ncbi:MAG: hypothetical protein QW404_00660 [Candidatus Nanoarchaeia archaeon]
MDILEGIWDKMYLYFFRAGKEKNGRVLTTEELDKDTNMLLSNFGFTPFYVDPENTNEKPSKEGKFVQKVYIQYENPTRPATAFKVITPEGNHLEWSDPNSGVKHLKSACYVGILGLPAPAELDDKSKEIVKALRDMRDNKYHHKLEERVTFEDTSFAKQYKKLLPRKNFFAFRVGKDEDGHVLKTATLDNETKYFLQKLGFSKWYWDPANKTLDKVTKVQIQYQVVGGGVSAFRVYIIEGNKLDYDDGRGNRFKAACYLGFPNLDHLENFDKVGMFENRSKEVKEVIAGLIDKKYFISAFSYLKNKYHPNLEDVLRKKFSDNKSRNKKH